MSLVGTFEVGALEPRSSISAEAHCDSELLALSAADSLILGDGDERCWNVVEEDVVPGGCCFRC